MLTRIIKKLNEIAGINITQENLLSLEFHFDGEEEIAIVWYNYNNDDDKKIIQVNEL